MANDLTIRQLLAEVSAISKKYDMIHQKTGGYFNIFDIANIEYDEVRLCRVLYELLHPKGKHYQGPTYLKLFMQHVLKITDILEDEFKGAKVHREYPIKDKRRIDLLIDVGEYTIPIEVKINALDLDQQCFAYSKVARKSNVYYLTLYGDLPSAKSAHRVSVTTISFESEIMLWLAKCLEHQDTIPIAPIREILLQLKSTILKITGQLEEGERVEVKEILMSSPENMESALDIEKSLFDVKTDMLRKVFSSIEKEFGKKKLDNEYDYTKIIDKFYERKGLTWPGISYVYIENVKEEIDIWFRVEIAQKLFAGFGVAYKGKAVYTQKLTEEEINKHLPDIENPKINGWWAYQEYLPDGNEDDSPNFKNPGKGDPYFKLFDENYFQDFIKQCVIKMNELYQKR